MKALITGITGFIGSHTAERLLTSGHEVLGIGQSPWPRSAPAELRAVPLVQWDIRKPASSEVLGHVHRFAPEVVFHFAAVSLPGQCGQNQPTALAQAVNVDGTQHAFQLAEQCAAKRFLFASSCHVYGTRTAENHRVSEDSPCRPSGAYGKTKLAAEHWLTNQAATLPIELCITRGFQHIGPRQPSGLMLSDWLDQLEKRPNHLRVRNEHSFMDLIDVRDAARGYERLGCADTCVNVCNVGRGQIVRSGDVLEVLLAKLNCHPQIEATSKDPQWNPIADSRRLCDLGWTPLIDYPETLNDMLKQRHLDPRHR